MRRRQLYTRVRRIGVVANHPQWKALRRHDQRQLFCGCSVRLPTGSADSGGGVPECPSALNTL